MRHRTRISILARRNGRGSRLADRTAIPSGRASTRNTRRLPNIRDRDSKVDRQRPPRPSRRHSMVLDRRKVRTPDRQYSNLHSLLPKTGLKAEEPAESIVSICFLFQSSLLFRDQQCSFSYNNIRFRQNFTRLHPRTATQRLDRASRRRLSRTRRCSHQLRDCRDAHTPRQCPMHSCGS
jgi:hypothetical protein